MLSAILGAGLLTLPFAVYINGLIFGPILIILGALMSYYTGYLLVSYAYCSVWWERSITNKSMRTLR